MVSTHVLHKGEMLLQKRRSTPEELSVSIPQYIDRNMPQQHAEFFVGLPYLPLATLDNRGRPWTSLLVTLSSIDPSIGITVSGNSQTDVVAETNPYDPFIRALGKEETASGDNRRLFAGVGVDFTNRRRNKLAGSLTSVSVESRGKINLRLSSNQHLGNCPKYITVRSLKHEVREAELAFDNFEAITSSLPDDAKALIDRASTTFLATKHMGDQVGASSDQRDMGLNHRGGAPGFVRLYEEEDGGVITSYLVLPDHSGNRFYQSLGNIETDKQVGLVFPDFTTGDVLYITGNAENLYDAEAEAIMPRVGLLTRIEVTGAVLVKGGINLRLTSNEEFSPYNPPVKYLLSELEEKGYATAAHETADLRSATLVSTRKLSENISTFTFDLTSYIDAPLPGGFGVFDFSNILDSGYRHMSEANPQLVNEDYIRTWTLSNAAEFDTATNKFNPINKLSITVKRKPGGLISNFLHEYAEQLLEQQLQIDFKGAGVGFSCFKLDPIDESLGIPKKMLWIAGGVGITPFMAMWDGITNVAKGRPDHLSSDIVLLFSGRDDDICVLKYFMTSKAELPDNVNLRILAFQSVGDDSSKAQAALSAIREEFPGVPIVVEQRRIQIADLEAVDGLANREIFLCGSDALMSWSKSSLNELGFNQSRIQHETFYF